MKVLASFTIALTLLAGALAAQQGSIAGKWTLVVESSSASGHEIPPVELELQQTGKKIIGNFVIADHGDLPLEGEFVDGALSLHATEDGYMKLELKGKLMNDGTLTGSMKSQMGDLTWTAKRTKVE